MLHRSLFFLAFPIALFACASMAQQEATAPLVSQDILAQAQLANVWQTKLAVKDCESIEKITMLGDKIYALTSMNYLFCVNAGSGETVFGMQLTSQGFPVLEPRAYGKYILIVAGNKLMQIDVERGATVYEVKFDFTVISPPVRNAQYIYTPGSDKRVHAIVAADKAEQFAVAATDDSQPTGLIAADGSLVFTSEQGDIICSAINGPYIIWELDTAGPITASPVRDNNELYIANGDTKLYKLSAATGKVEWKYPCGGILTDSPRVTSAAVYQRVPYKGITAVDKNTGRPMWTLDNGADLLAEAGSKAYIMTCERTVAVMDNATGKRLYTINFSQVGFCAANTRDGRIFVGDLAGRLACISAAK